MREVWDAVLAGLAGVLLALLCRFPSLARLLARLLPARWESLRLAAWYCQVPSLQRAVRNWGVGAVFPQVKQSAAASCFCCC